MSLSEAPPVAPTASVLPPPPNGAPAPEGTPIPVTQPDPQLAAEPQPDPGADGPERRTGLGRLPRVPFELFLAVLIGAILLGVVTLTNQVNRNDAEAGRRDAEQSLATAESSATEMATANADLAATNADLVEANGNFQIKVDVLEEDLETESVARETAEKEAEDLGAIPEFDTTPLDDEIDALADQVTELEEQNSDLTEAVAAAEAAASKETESPSFSQYLGEVLSADAGIPATATESRCLGQTVIDDLGFEAVGAGLNAAQTTDTAGALDASFSAAVTSCGVNPVDEAGA